MKNYILFLAAIWTTVSLCSCDDGRIYEQHVDIERGGYVLKLTGRFSGLGNWADGYSVAWQVSMTRASMQSLRNRCR